jgi:hypothetical protein
MDHVLFSHCTLYLKYNTTYLVWIELHAPKRYIDVLDSGICECDLTWKQGLFRYDQSKTCHQDGP